MRDAERFTQKTNFWLFCLAVFWSSLEVHIVLSDRGERKVGGCEKYKKEGAG